MDQAFIEQNYAYIYRMAWTMTGCATEAEDLAQDTFIVALDRWNAFDGRSQRKTWLIGILVNLKSRRDRSLGRFKRRLVNCFLQARANRESSPLTELMRREWQQSVWSQVARLPPAQRDVVVLRFAEQLTHDEIAEAVGCPVGTVRTRLHHAMKRLQQFPELRILGSMCRNDQPDASVRNPNLESNTCKAT